MNTTSTRPDLSAFARTPAEMVELDRWCVWRRETPAGRPKPTKVPYNARTGWNAKSNNPGTWSSYIEALEAYATGRWSGIGFMLGDGWAGVDLDNCIGDGGDIEPSAVEIIDTLNTYTEISPSLHGVKMITMGTLPPGRRRKGSVEMYCLGRFFTVTGNAIRKVPIEDRTEQLAIIHAKVFPPEPARVQTPRAQATPASADDQLIINKVVAAPKWAQLWNGNMAGYDSASEADLALCGRIAFFAGPDAGRISSIFSQSGLDREKWDRQDYRERTINKALSGMTRFCEWRVSSAGEFTLVAHGKNRGTK